MEYKEIDHYEYGELMDRCGRYKILTDWSLIGFRNTTEYMVDGKLHREDGPAVIRERDVNYGYDEYLEWHLNGINYSRDEWFLLLTEEQLAIALANPENF